ncbi:hypothetical protein J1770_gp43 [Gordonia phage EMoore]|uniref:Uncharacterized protein n=1 Tax=Gordonia phage EMoore TaxID=2656534 RepID=A0A649VV95_9CAUD|nr:hypothetical protein J1770_gp43 [Gordonia phage EMoore]QGJ95829.1 hypothetical protein SEA_EMOORE_43 [Gordonia phage EMoore]
MTTAPTDNRPESVEDMTDSIHDGDLSFAVLTVHDLPRIARVPGALAALGILLDALRNDTGDRGTETTEARRGVVVTDVANSGVISVKQPFTDAEGARQLATAQERYDRGRVLYQEYLDLLGDDGAGHRGDLDEFATKHRYTWAYYLRREGIPSPTEAK